MEAMFDIRLIHFALTVVFSFLIGLEIKTYQMRFHAAEKVHVFGSARTYTFLGMLGYLFWLIGLPVYIAALAGVTLLYALFYFQRLRKGKTSVLLYLAILIVYSFGPLTEHYALWLPSLVFVMTIFVLNAKQKLRHMTEHLNVDELETVGKMVLLSAVILPLLPHQKIGHFLPLSPFEIWTAVVIVSAISYGGYLAQKYFFKERGYLVAGIVGGIYSSTATTVVLARKASELGNTPVLTASIVAASAIMYLRLIFIAAIFNTETALKLLLPFGALALIGFVIAALYAFNRASDGSVIETADTNPLELGTAFLFAVLFMAMMALTQFVTAEFGSDGLRILSFVVGFTDIDPFVLSLVTGHYRVIDTHEIAASVILAAGSNNLLKALYAVWFGGFAAGRSPALWLALLGLGTIGTAFVV